MRYNKLGKKRDPFLTKIILFAANFFYFLIFLGFCLTTNYNPVILHKYTIGYFKNLILLFLLIVPYNLLLLFLLNNSFVISYKKRNIKLTFVLRLTIVLLLLILFLLLTELFLRMKPKPYVEDFHPFLQTMITKKNEDSLHVDSSGFRYDDLTIDKPKGVYRIFLLGSSTVFDKTRSYDKTISKQLENMLRKHYATNTIQVINAGYERYTSEHSLILYETKIQDYHPDLVVLWQGFNDMYYSCTPDGTSFLPTKTYKNDYSHFYEGFDNILNNYFNFHPTFLTIDRITKAFNENFYTDVRNNLPESQSIITYFNKNSWQSLNAYTRNTTDIVKLAKADNVKIILGNEPNHYDSNPKNYGLIQYYCKQGTTFVSIPSINKGMAEFNKETKKIAQQNNIPFIDLESQLPKTDKYFTDDVHYTDIGDKKITQSVYQAIINSGYLEKREQ